MTQPTYDRASQDVGNVLALEHVNVTVPDQELAHLFYVTGLGFTRDPYIDFGVANMWINVGAQQFHLPRNDPQVLRGRVGVVVPDLDRVRRRLESLEKRAADRLAGTRFGFAEVGGVLEVTCPYGNRIDVHRPDSRFGPVRLGIAYVEMDVAPGTADGIARFYRDVMGAPASLEPAADAACAVVRLGRWQTFRFRETAAELAPYDGHHVAVYLVNFSSPYAWLRERGLITLETNEHEYRFQDIVDPDDGRVLATIEHEVRSLFHPMYGRELTNRDAGQSFAAYERGRDAFVGLTHGGSA